MSMAVLAPSRPELTAHREAVTLPFPALVKGLVDIIGKKLTAYVGSVKDVRAVERWIDGSEPYRGAVERLRLAYVVARMISDSESNRVAQSWLTGVNPELGDKVPLRMIREGEPDTIAAQVLGAARAFLAGG